MRESIEGYFYLPNSQEIQAFGTLSYSYSGGIELKITGSLSSTPIALLRTYEVINGFTTTGKLITLMNCFSLGVENHFPGISTERYHARELIIGNAFEHIPKNIFTGVKMHIEGIEDWLDLQLVTVTDDFKNQYVKFEYTNPEDMKFEISGDLTLSIRHIPSFPLGRSANRIKFKSKAVLFIESKKGLGVEEIIALSYKLRLLLTFFTLKPYYADEITIRSPIKKKRINGQEIDDWHGLYYHQMSENHQKYASDDDRFAHFKYLMPFPIVQHKFQTLVCGWFENYELLSPILESYFSYYYLPPTTIESKFLHIIQAFEAFHRRTRNNQKIPKISYKAKMKEILASVPVEHKSWIQEKLAFGYEPSLKERLEDLFNDAELLGFGDTFKNTDVLIKKIRDTRNYLTHYDVTMKSKAMSHDEMNIVSNSIANYLMFLIFKYLGMSPDAITSIVQNGRQFGLIWT